MPTLDCPRAIVEPPTCSHPQQVGMIRFRVRLPSYILADEHAAIECIDQSCACELTEAEWRDLEWVAVEKALEDVVGC